MKTIMIQAFEMMQPHIGEAIRKVTIYPAMRAIVPVKVCGEENLTNLDSPVVFIANHSSHLDTLSILKALPSKQRLQTKVAAASDYFYSSGWKGTLVSTLFNCISFSRKGDGCFTSLMKTQHLLKDGKNILIFPEGTRSIDGQLHEFKKGAAHLVKHSGVAVVPIRLEGTFEAMSKGARFPRPHHITVTFGEPMRFSETASTTEINAAMEQQLRRMAGIETIDTHNRAA
jgi:1-acyl-sn-glycerol-3-phosphate acyltransferase